MSLLPLTSLGVSSQSSQALVIEKSRLSGLMPSSNNTAESLLAAILGTVVQQFQGHLTANGQPLTANGKPLTYDNRNHWHKLIEVEPWGVFTEDGRIFHTFIFKKFGFDLEMDFIDLPEKNPPALTDLLVIQDVTNEVTYKLVLGNLPFLSTTNNKQDYFRQVSPPTIFSTGTRWDEVDSNGHLIEKWTYNGTDWESEIKEFNWFLSGGASNSTGYPLRNDHKYKILRWQYTLIANTAWNASNFVAVTFWRSSAATNTVINTVTYNTATVGQVRQIETDINQIFDFQSTVADRLALGVTVTGTLSFNYSTLIKYQLIRR